MLPSPAGVKFENPIQKGESIAISEVWTPENLYNADFLSVVVFAQNEDNGQVYQTAKIDFATSIVSAMEQDLEKDGLVLYPNPASDHTTIMFKHRTVGNTNIMVYDQYGRIVDQVNVPDGTKDLKIETGNYSIGIYMIQVLQKDNPVIHKKLLITK